MNSYPLESISLLQAQQFQFRLIDEISYVFKGYDILNLGDLGVHQNGNIPQTTQKVEQVIARFFDAEDAVLLRGAGTNAIKEAIYVYTNTNRNIFVHDAPIYSTTKTTLSQLNINLSFVDYNDEIAIENAIQNNPHIKVALVQYTRQKLSDCYDIEKVITIFKKYDIKVVTDDNYAVMKVSKIGTQCGADLSCFSCFKLLGPEGIGCIVGEKNAIDVIRNLHYSGGSQVQGFEAMEVLRGLIYAPVPLAIQAEQTNLIVEAINNGVHDVIKKAFIVNAQSKVVIVQLNMPIAKQVIKVAETKGALPHPVGSESKYEFMPLFYKVSGTMLQDDSSAVDYYIRINPMRAGKDTVLRILIQSIEEVKNVFK